MCASLSIALIYSRKKAVGRKRRTRMTLIKGAKAVLLGASETAGSGGTAAGAGAAQVVCLF